MFDLFKQDIKVGNKVKLYLTTGKEPEGMVVTIGDNFVLLQADDKTQNRIFDKLIGGWEIILTENTENASQEKANKNRIDNSQINQSFLIEKVNKLKSSIDRKTLSRSIESNATIFKVNPTNCTAKNNLYPDILIAKNRFADFKLSTMIENFHNVGIIPVVIKMINQQNRNIASAAALPNSLEGYIDNLIEFIKQKKYHQASILLFIIGDELKLNRDFIFILKELKKFEGVYIEDENNSVQILKNEVKAFKNIEKEINDLIRNSKFDSALTQIEKELLDNFIEDKYKSSLLLKKAQIFSSINNLDASESAYIELVLFNEKTRASSNNLSHLYTEIARLQALKVDKQVQAIESVKKALKHNPNNNYALNLLKQLEGKGNKLELDYTLKSETGEHLMILEAEDDSTAISKMIDLDIKEHKYVHSEIIKNGGKPTAFIAKLIFDEAKKTREVDLSERYPIYLEAAKAFSELNVGSYDLQDYLEAVAYYSMLKGNSLFINFRNNLLTNDLDILKLTRLRDSACSYYIESLNLLSNIEPKLLLSILANYLKLNLITYHIKKESVVDYKIIFKGQFDDVFKDCIRNKNREIEAIAYKAIVDCGASSINAWNKLAYLPNGVGVLYGDLTQSKRKKEIFNLINSFEGNIINTDLRPGEFFKNTFFERRDGIKTFSIRMSNLSKIEIEPQNIDLLIKSWSMIGTFDKYITPTDKEVKDEIDILLEILQPYLNRGEKERLNIFIQIRTIIEKQINFINDNTTFYGRTFFYGLLNKWKKEIDILLEEKILQSYPLLDISIDPPYYIKTNSEITAPLIIKNNGEATAEGFSLKITCESTEYEDKEEIPFESDREIAAENKIETSFAIQPHLLSDSKAVEIKIEIQAIYQKKKLTPRYFEFTIEEEPKSRLTYEDIPWKDGPIPPEQLFKGRKKLISDLSQHYLSVEKDKPYILYGLTRTGKSSVLEYLKKDIEGFSFHSKGREMLVLTFNWDLSEAASFKKASDFWRYILYQQTYEEIEKYAPKYGIDVSHFTINDNTRAKDFRIILEFLQSKGIYPVFLVDEFSFVKTLIDDCTINSAFLHTLRQYSLSELASFIFAGTYDIKSLITDPKYGITGQLVNAIEEQINEISEDAAEELIEVINDKLTFTPEAVGHIKFLSGNVPYFIQIICKYCGYYASENKRRYIGYPELEKVIKILIGQIPSSSDSLVKKLPENIFQNNQFSPADPKEVAVLISCITYLNRDRIADPRGIGFSELQKLWADKNIIAFRPKLAEAINLLKEKKILLQGEDEGIPVYSLAVDLFRRWWSNHNPDIDLTLTTLTE